MSAQDIYPQAVKLLSKCVTEQGFIASPSSDTNYNRIWARDGIIMGLSALLSTEQELIHTFRNTLITLSRNQGPHGEIPSNYDYLSQRISYGGTTGRVDANLWFIIGCYEYWQETGDEDFLQEILPCIEKVRFLLGAWEFNNRGLIYVPQAGDWADEYLQSGYVLYDQVLYYRALESICGIHRHIHNSQDHELVSKTLRLKHLIQANYWLGDTDTDLEIYHEVLYEKGLKSRPECRNSYWMPFFSPIGYGYRFDSFANILVSVFGIADGKQQVIVDQYIDSISHKKLKLIPAFYPVILPVDKDWEDLQMIFSFTFKNNPHEYHNGGLWPMLSGFYVYDLCQRGLHKRANIYADAINHANGLEYRDISPSFPEFLHGETLQPGGTAEQGWSAAATIISHHALSGKRLFRDIS